MDSLKNKINMNWIDKIKEKILEKWIEYFIYLIVSFSPNAVFAVIKKYIMELNLTFSDYFWLTVLPLAIFIVLVQISLLRDGIKEARKKEAEYRAKEAETLELMYYALLQGLYNDVGGTRRGEYPYKNTNDELAGVYFIDKLLPLIHSQKISDETEIKKAKTLAEIMRLLYEVGVKCERTYKAAESGGSIKKYERHEDLKNEAYHPDKLIEAYSQAKGKPYKPLA